MDINVEKIKEGIDKATEFTVKKTGEIVSYTKLKFKIADLKGKVSDMYKEIGEMIYVNSKEEGDISERLQFAINKIDDLKEEIAECAEALDSIKE